MNIKRFAINLYIMILTLESKGKKDDYILERIVQDLLSVIKEDNQAIVRYKKIALLLKKEEN